MAALILCLSMAISAGTLVYSAHLASTILAAANATAAATIARAADYTRSATLGDPGLPPPPVAQGPRDRFDFDPAPDIDWDAGYDTTTDGLMPIHTNGDASDGGTGDSYGVGPGEELIAGLAREDPPWQ